MCKSNVQTNRTNVKIIFKPIHGRALANCIKDYTVVAENVKSIEEFINSNYTFVINERRGDSIQFIYNRPWVKFSEESGEDERLGIIRKYDVYASARFNIEKDAVEMLDEVWYIGDLCEVDSSWSLEDYPDYNHTVPEP